MSDLESMSFREIYRTGNFRNISVIYQSVKNKDLILKVHHQESAMFNEGIYGIQRWTNNGWQVFVSGIVIDNPREKSVAQQLREVLMIFDELE